MIGAVTQRRDIPGPRNERMRDSDAMQSLTTVSGSKLASLQSTSNGPFLSTLPTVFRGQSTGNTVLAWESSTVRVKLGFRRG